MAQGLCHILRSFLVCQQAHRISVYIDHVPGITNDMADSLSRGSDPLSLGLEASQEFPVLWDSFPASPEISLFPSAADFILLSLFCWRSLSLILSLAVPAAAVKRFARLQFGFTAGRIEQQSSPHPVLLSGP